jgi:hypothetical protein
LIQTKNPYLILVAFPQGFTPYLSYIIPANLNLPG